MRTVWCQHTLARLASISFFLNRGFDKPLRVDSSQISLFAKLAEGSVISIEGTPLEGMAAGFAFLGGKLIEKLIGID